MKLKQPTGFTLVELLIVIALFVMIVTIVVPSVNSITGANLKVAASGVAGAIRFTYDLAARKSVPFRVVFDLDEHAYWVESSSERFLLGREKTEVHEGKLSSAEDQERRGTKSFVTRSYIESGEMWHPKPQASFSSFAGSLTKKASLPAQIAFQDVWVTHQSDRVTTGQAYLYCFPTGVTERAVIHLVDDEQEAYTLWVEPLTGDVKIYPYYLEAPEE